MPSTESDLSPLDSIKRLPRPLRHAFNACLVIGGLVGGGGSIGYFLGVQQTRKDALDEISRLQGAYGLRIDRAADAATGAAVAANGAAIAATNAAEAVGEAAVSATTAANAARAAAAAQTNPAPRREQEGKQQ